MAAELWMYSFADTPAFTDWYFRRRAGEVFALLDDQDLVAQIVSVPLSLSIRDAACDAAMLSGITTAPARRGEGHMSALIRESLAFLRERGVCAAALYPFDYDYYRRYGFAACGEVARLKVELSRLPGGALSG
ncbi:MAG: GNAT family N-acetyltransferase, partial [Clostridiales bacterium]|nr:GNAT family N-acetyltransferase [Clostridiales bacterium]